MCIQYHFYCNVLNSEVSSAYIILAGQIHMSTAEWSNQSFIMVTVVLLTIVSEYLCFGIPIFCLTVIWSVAILFT